MNYTQTSDLTPIADRSIQQLGMSLAAKNLNPTVLNPDFIKYSGIIPRDWEIKQNSVFNSGMVQINFQNGVSIVAQPENISFVETIATKTDLEQPKLVNLVNQFVQRLPQAEYLAVSTSPKAVVPVDDQELAKKYITQILLANGSWQNFGQGLVQAGINLLYQLERCQLALSINEARLKQPNKPESIAALLFSGNFNYPLPSELFDVRLTQIADAINYWQQDIEIFQQLVYDQFLAIQTQMAAASATVFPNI